MSVMRPRIARLLGSARGAVRSKTTSSGGYRDRLSVAITGTTSKNSVIYQLRKHVSGQGQNISPFRTGSNTRHAAVILATRDFATWLQDEGFMMKFMSVLGSRLKFSGGDGGPTQSIDVLSGIADGIGPANHDGETRKGFSILYGSDVALPNLWEIEAITGTLERSADTAASISFLCNKLLGTQRGLEITLPLANTLFQNGRRSTLFASRWEAKQDTMMALSKLGEKSHQQIVSSEPETSFTTPHIPLIPVTPPRKIVSGLGNIVRQIETDGVAGPASRELELLIPQLYDRRSESHPDAQPAPIKVWAWIIPQHMIDHLDYLFKLPTLLDFLGKAEGIVPEVDVQAFQKLLPSGCSIHRILSGGGGWGAKQGLLSLDPEVAYAASEQEDVESFIEAFRHRNDEEQSVGLIKPGSYIFFCVEPSALSLSAGSTDKAMPGSILGVAANEDDEMPVVVEGGKIEIIGGQFGAMSASGLYLTLSPSVEGESEVNVEATESTALKAKVDVPGALFYNSLSTS